MSFYTKSSQEVLAELTTKAEGLTSQEVSARREKYGLNELQQAKKKTNFQRFLDQFKDVMIIILLVAALVSFGIACVNFAKDSESAEALSHFLKELFEPGLILLIVVLNAIMGVMQESKAEKALEALKSMSAPHSRVIRDGQEQVVESSQLVPGDIIRLEAGDFVPADARLLKSVNLKCEESALTGESVPSEKEADAVIDEKAPLGDRSNMIYSGCSVSYGTAMAVVTSTGMDTEMGKIANLLSGEQDGQTPLQKKLAQLGKYLGFLALGVCAIIFGIGMVSGLNYLEIFMTAVSLAVSAIPEGLPAIVTIVLSIGVQRMAKRNAVIRRLPAVETLGGASIICSDKTGTLTQNRMTLMKAYVEDGPYEDISRENSDKVRKLLSYATLCCDGSIRFENGQVQHIGDPTETAIILATHNNGLEQAVLNGRFPRVAELPFDSDRKLMTSVNEINGKLMVIVKGAFDMMVPRCIKGDLEKARQINDEMSSSALRVIAVAYKEIDELPKDLSTLEQELIFMGLVGMIDPPRPECAEAVRTCLRAGIKPVMITGDHVVTASAIAKALGILQPGQKAITGAQLDAMTDEELDAQVEQISVYARVSPENKIRIVKAWQRKDQIVAMTGDGVNDAPALKAADIGCAMGITGTDVAKGAADMTLSDDNFATIVEAVKEGRGIYNNIKKVVGFLLGTNIGEVITVFFAMLLWQKTPLLSMQLLWINLVTDSLPAIALGMEPIEKGIMDEKPRPKKEGLFAHGLGLRVVLQGLMFGILSLVAYYTGETVMRSVGEAAGMIGQELIDYAVAGGQTMAFTVLALCQIVQAFNMRSDRSIFKIGVFGNKTLNKAALISVALMALVLFTPVRNAFGLILLSPAMYLIALGLIFVPLVVMELAKALKLIK